jgi:hypothetical protein
MLLKIVVAINVFMLRFLLGYAASAEDSRSFAMLMPTNKYLILNELTINQANSTMQS